MDLRHRLIRAAQKYPQIRQDVLPMLEKHAKEDEDSGEREGASVAQISQAARKGPKSRPSARRKNRGKEGMSPEMEYTMMGPTQVARLPLGALVVPLVNNQPSLPALAVLMDGHVMPVDTLPEGPSGYIGDGDMASAYGPAFALVSPGHDALPPRAHAENRVSQWLASHRAARTASDSQGARHALEKAIFDAWGEMLQFQGRAGNAAQWVATSDEAFEGNQAVRKLAKQVERIQDQIVRQSRVWQTAYNMSREGRQELDVGRLRQDMAKTVSMLKKIEDLLKKLKGFEYEDKDVPEQIDDALKIAPKTFKSFDDAMKTFRKMSSRTAGGCEKLPPALRENCEKKKKEGEKDDKKDDGKKTAMTLRSRLIRLAKEKPELRPALLPILRNAATRYDVDGEMLTKAAMVNPRNVQVMLSLRKGDKVTVDTPKLRKPRVLTVLSKPETHRNTNAIMVYVMSGKVRPGHRGGGVLTYRPEKTLESGAVIPEELTYQPTMLQNIQDVSSLKKSPRSQEKYLMASQRRAIASNMKRVIDGPNIRVMVEDRGPGDIQILEMPKKPLKRRVVNRATIRMNRPGQRPFNAFIPQNILQNAKITKSDTFDRAMKKLKDALTKAEERTMSEWTEQQLGDPSPWFPRVTTEEVNYLMVEPADHKPMTLQGEGFQISSTWMSFDAKNFYNDDPHEPSYSAIESRSPASARKFYKMAKLDPNQFKNMSYRQFTDWLAKNKIATKQYSSSWR